MPELRVVAVSNDGSRLVLKAADSTEYFLPIDERLRAAVRGDRPRLGQIDVESHLRPRDIQARIRAGATAEEVAQQAGISVERVRRFEGPVLAERAFMAERARKTSVRRAGESTGPQLGDAVAERLLLRGADKDSTVWDSWRRDDSTWEIVLSYHADGAARQARWTYDPPRRLVQPIDDEARALIGETPERVEEPTFPFVPRIARLPGADRGMGMRPHAPERTPIERVPVERVPTERSSTERVPVERVPIERVPIERKPIERPTGERTTGDRTAEPPAASAAASAASPSSVASQVGPVPPVDSLTSILDVASPGAVSGESSEAIPVEPEAPAAAAVGAGSAYADILMPRTASPHRDRLVGSTDRQAEADGVRPGRRAAVPSWDEIVFGTRRKKQD